MTTVPVKVPREQQGLLERHVAQQYVLTVGRIEAQTGLAEHALNKGADVYSYSVYRSVTAVAASEKMVEAAYPQEVPPAVAAAYERLTADFLAGVTCIVHETIGHLVASVAQGTGTGQRK